MPIDTGLVVVIAAVLIFYLRLIVIQRGRLVRRVSSRKPPARKKAKAHSQTPPAHSRS